jgi:hypothetical protein
MRSAEMLAAVLLEEDGVLVVNLAIIRLQNPTSGNAMEGNGCFRQRSSVLVAFLLRQAAEGPLVLLQASTVCAFFSGQGNSLMTMSVLRQAAEGGFLLLPSARASFFGLGNCPTPAIAQ